ncbi:MAG TPA: HAMP domain-containing sensor histidine kinase [Sphingomicrobium sp.]|nr:HAMP domain-containing sensor histidine kinase [Sphingomicrobium sp.]
MASAPSEPRIVHGRLDSAGRLVEADAELEALQRDAGSSLGEQLALPQVAAVARLARTLGTSVFRPAIAAASDRDVELWVQATPQGDDVLLSLDNWVERPASGPRLAVLLGGNGAGEQSGGARFEWATDEELRLIEISSDLAELAGIDPAEAARQPLTRLFRLEEGEGGEMPLLAGLGARRDFSGQRARGRVNSERLVLLSAKAVSASDGSFAGFRGTAEPAEQAPEAAPGMAPLLDQSLDDMLRSPLDRIIESAARITDRAEGPLRSDYASYGNDIAAAARHLLSVLTTMSRDPGEQHRVIDLASLAGEAVVMLESSAEERGVTIRLTEAGPLRARGEERAVIQILVNLMVNAIRYSPEGGAVEVGFATGRGMASVTVADQGPGIAPADQQRIFERFERAQSSESGTGLGLAISRRLARSMGGDILVESSPGEGARFTLELPAV